MSNKSKVVDLVMGEDGAYSERGTSTSNKSTNKLQMSKTAQFKLNNADAVLPTDVEEFFNGLDFGLDFIEGVRSRVGRFMDLRD